MKRLLKKLGTRGIKSIAALFFAAILILGFVVADIFAPLEYRVQDAVFQRERLLHPDIMVVGIDEYSLNTFGQWPWPRSIMAEAIDIMMSDPDGFVPAVIALDILYTEPGAITECDDALVDAARRAGNVIMASHLHLEVVDAALTVDATAHNRPFYALLPYVRYGVINAILDTDGVIRNAMLWERYGDQVVHSFPVQIARMYREFWGMETHSDFVAENASMYIAYSGLPGFGGRLTGDFWEMSFAEIFDPWFDPGSLYGRIVMIGTYAMGMRDAYPVPIARVAPMHGVEIHANVVQALLDGNYKLYAPPFMTPIAVLGAIVIAMLLGEFFGLRVNLLVLVPLTGAYVAGGLYLYNTQGLVSPMLAPPLALWVVFLYQLIYGYVLTSMEKGTLRRTFSKYVDPKLVELMIKKGTADDHGVGKHTHLACLFVDVRNFTTMSELLGDTPGKVVEILNDYLELTSRSVFECGGSVDKFVGDATMALFNGFVPQSDYIYKAVQAAWKIVQGADAVNKRIKAQYGIDIGFGVGVHCGYAIVGNLGPTFRKDYTAIGDTINTAARLESNSSAGQVLISLDVARTLEGRIHVESLGEIMLKGKALPIEVFELKGLV